MTRLEVELREAEVNVAGLQEKLQEALRQSNSAAAESEARSTRTRELEVRAHMVCPGILSKFVVEFFDVFSLFV